MEIRWFYHHLYLHKGISYNGKMTFLYWTRAHNSLSASNKATGGLSGCRNSLVCPSFCIFFCLSFCFWLFPWKRFIDMTSNLIDTFIMVFLGWLTPLNTYFTDFSALYIPSSNSLGQIKLPVGQVDFWHIFFQILYKLMINSEFRNWSK